MDPAPIKQLYNPTEYNKLFEQQAKNLENLEIIKKNNEKIEVIKLNVAEKEQILKNAEQEVEFKEKMLNF